MKKAILADLTRLGREAGLKSFEQVTTLLHVHKLQMRGSLFSSDFSRGTDRTTKLKLLSVLFISLSE
jgi:hypothetical protein